MIQNLQCFSLLEGTKRPSGNYFIRFCPVSQGFQTFFRFAQERFQTFFRIQCSGGSVCRTSPKGSTSLTFSFGASRRTPWSKYPTVPYVGPRLWGMWGIWCQGKGFYIHTYMDVCMHVGIYTYIYICIFNYVLYILYIHNILRLPGSPSLFFTGGVFHMYVWYSATIQRAPAVRGELQSLKLTWNHRPKTQEDDFFHGKTM